MLTHTAAAQLLDCSVSAFNSVKDTRPKPAQLREFLLGTGKFAQAAQQAEAAQNEILAGVTEQRKKELKAKLPAATISAEFQGGRKLANLSEYSGLICLDFDDLERPQESLEALKDCPYIAFANLSISARGIFAIVPLAQPERHKESFAGLQSYFNERFALRVDSACKDITRLRIFAPPAQAWENPNAEAFELGESQPEPPRKATQRPLSKPDLAAAPLSDYYNAKAVCEALEAQGIDITSDYQDWLNLGFALANLGESGRALFHSISCNYPSYCSNETDRQFSDCLKSGRGEIKLGTLFFLAKELGGLDVSKLIQQTKKAAQASKAEAEAAQRAPAQQVWENLEAQESLADCSQLTQAAQEARKISIQAPTGSGKTFWALRKLAPALGAKTLLLVPLAAQVRQIIQEYGIHGVNYESTKHDIAEAEGAQIAVCTWDSIHKIGRRFRCFIFDESHDLTAAQSYRRAALLRAKSFARNFGSKIIYMSATPNSNFMDTQGARAIKVNVKNHYHKAVTVRDLRGENKSAEGAILQRVKQYGRKRLINQNRLLVFHLNSLKKIQRAKAKLLAEGFQESEIKLMHAQAEESEFTELIENQRLTHEGPGRALVVLATSVIQSGLNIKQPGLNIDFIYIQGQCEPPSAAAVTQAAGRFRTYLSLQSEFWHRLDKEAQGKPNNYQYTAYFAEQLKAQASQLAEVLSVLGSEGAQVKLGGADSTLSAAIDKSLDGTTYEVNTWAIVGMATEWANWKATLQDLRQDFEQYDVRMIEGKAVGSENLKEAQKADKEAAQEARKAFYEALQSNERAALEAVYWQDKDVQNDLSEKIAKLYELPSEPTQDYHDLIDSLGELIQNHIIEIKALARQWLKLRARNHCSIAQAAQLCLDSEGKLASQYKIGLRIKELQQLALMEFAQNAPKSLDSFDFQAARWLQRLQQAFLSYDKLGDSETLELAQKYFDNWISAQGARLLRNRLIYAKEGKTAKGKAIIYRPERQRTLADFCKDNGISFTDFWSNYLEGKASFSEPIGEKGQNCKSLKFSKLEKRGWIAEVYNMQIIQGAAIHLQYLGEKPI